MPVVGCNRMHSTVSGHIRSLGPGVRRAAWLLIAAAHLPGLVSSWRVLFTDALDMERLGACGVLTLTMIFFALKVRGVAFLRFRTDRRSRVAVCIVVALLHLDVFRPSGVPTVVPECAILVATTWLVGSLPVVRRGLRSVLARAGSAFKYRPPITPSTDTVWLDTVRPRCWTLAFFFFSLRGPPRSVSFCRAG